MSEPFAELLGRSCFSFLEGASHPEEMVAQANELGLSDFALCDRDGIYGVVRAHGEAKKRESRLIIGSEFTLERNGQAYGSMGLLVKSDEGYRNLCRLLTEAHA